MQKQDDQGGGVRRRYDETYKRQVVELALRGDRSMKQLAAELGVGMWALYEWRRRYAPPVPQGHSGPKSLAEAEAEITRLQAEIGRLREREIVLKKSLGILSEAPESGMPKSRP